MSDKNQVETSKEYAKEIEWTPHRGTKELHYHKFFQMDTKLISKYLIDTPDPSPPAQFLEAENAVLKGVHAVSGNDAFSNGSFAEYDKAKGGSVTFDFSVKITGVIQYLPFSQTEKAVLKTCFIVGQDYNAA